MSTTTDASVIAKSLEEGEAFFAIFERHFAAINRYLRRRLNVATADELTGDVFAVAFARRRSFDLAQPDALPWLFGIASNLLRNRLRVEQRELRLIAGIDVNVVAAGSEPLEILLRSSVEPSLARALLALSPQDRDVLLLFAWGELDYQEISTALGLPLGTVKSRLNRARSRVIEALRAGAETKEACHG